ncbi:MAG: hypothetical protein D8H98_14215 [Prevotella sp.]|nr:MAG: hypothetical protein D8H98_14215 [Prevotella sp.]
MVVANLPAFRLRFLFACTQPNLFCLVFGAKFNILGALFVRQSFTLPKKTILAKVVVDAKRGGMWMLSK